MLADDVNLPDVKPVFGDNIVNQDSSPVHTHQVAVTIDGVHTDIVYQMFSDKLFIIATQLGKMGTLISCESDGLGGGGRGVGGGEAAMDINAKVLLGNPDEPLLLVFASNLFKKLTNFVNRKTILISVGLKEKNVRLLQTLEKVIVENRIS